MKASILFKVYFIIKVLENELVKMDLSEMIKILPDENIIQIYPILTSTCLKLENLNELNLSRFLFAKFIIIFR